jgi:hypothetical protein
MGFVVVQLALAMREPRRHSAMFGTDAKAIRRFIRIYPQSPSSAPSNLSERISPFGAELCNLDGAAQRRMNSTATWLRQKAPAPV